MAAPDLAQLVSAYFEQSASTIRTAGPLLAAPIVAAARLVVDCHAQGGTVFVFGNGGSAAEAQHFAGELVGRYQRERRPLAAIALGTDPATVTCIANDFSFEEVFARQLLALGKAGDVAIGLSTSGRSPNVLRAVEAARGLGMHTVAFVGGGEAPLGDLADLVIRAPATTTSRVQECHTAAIHALTELIETLTFDSPA
jgi:D-sedoheptulose 7-phosphate isomerase